MIVLEILGMVLVIAAIASFAEGKPTAGFWFNIASAVVWSGVATGAQLFGLLALQAVIVTLAFRGLYNLRKGRRYG